MTTVVGVKLPEMMASAVMAVGSTKTPPALKGSLPSMPAAKIGSVHLVKDRFYIELVNKSLDLHLLGKPPGCGSQHSMSCQGVAPNVRLVYTLGLPWAGMILKCNRCQKFCNSCDWKY